MCIVIDINTISRVFNPDNSEHDEYKYIKDWLFKCKDAKMVYGGKTYNRELMLLSRYRKLILEYNKRTNFLCNVSDELVDQEEEIVKDLLDDDNGCDDPHIIAIIRASKCKLVCTHDRRSMPYLKNSDLYESPSDRPKIYSNKKNSKLLKDQHIANCCKN